MISGMYFDCKRFAELSSREVYLIAKLRQDVFILEQQSIYMDLDDLDQESWHFVATSASDTKALLVAYTRLRYLPTKNMYKIERVVCDKNYRGQGIANVLIAQVLKKSQMLSAQPRLNLSSQLSVVAFYEKFGFSIEGDVYDDGGIDHIDMLLSL